jgi:hypothetical protein
MFITQEDHDVTDFLKSLSFVPPPGTQVAYFIVPPGEGMRLPQNSGFRQEAIDTPEDESITYVRQEPVLKQDQAQTPADYSQFDPDELGRRTPTPNILPQITEPEDLESPFVKVLSESKVWGTDIKLLEAWGPFPKGTLFHCVSSKLAEGLMDELKARNDTPEMKAAREKYLATKKAKEMKTAARKADRKENEFTFNQLAKMVPDGEEAEFVKTRTPFVFDIIVAGKRYKRISRPDAKIEKYRLVEAELKEPNLFMKALTIPSNPHNQTGLYTVGINKELDTYIDASLEEGKTPKEIAQKVWNNKYYRKSFEKQGGEINDLSTYIFRRSQKFEVAGDGESGQQVFKDFF